MLTNSVKKKKDKGKEKNYHFILCTKMDWLHIKKNESILITYKMLVIWTIAEALQIVKKCSQCAELNI